MAIISRLEIEGFKSIWKDTLDLGQFNVFIGVNGAGKSNLLEALAMISSSLEGGISYENLHRRGSRLSSSAIFRSAFRNKDRRSALRLAISIGNASYQVSANAVDGFRYLAESIKADGMLIAGRSNNGATINRRSLPSRIDSQVGIFPLLEATVNLGHTKDPVLKEAVADLARIADYSIYAPATPLLRGVEQDSSAKEPLGLYGGRLAEALAEVFSHGSEKQRRDILRFFDLMGWVKSFGITEATDEGLLSGHVNLGTKKLRYQDRFMKTNFNNLYAYDVSEGALYVLFILVLLVHQDSPSMFALDNLDSSLNPGLVRHLTSQISEILKKNPQKQIFVTTHNPSALDGLDLFDPSHRLFVVERDEHGHTKSKRVSPPQGMSRDQWNDMYGGLRLSEIWLSGAIGGLPTAF